MNWIDEEKKSIGCVFFIFFFIFRSSRIVIFQRERDRSCMLYFLCTST